MAVASLTTLPAAFFAGDTVKVAISGAVYPAPGFVVTLALNGPARFTKDATANGADHALTLASADTAERPPGVYAWAIFATETATGERVTICTGSTWMKPNPANGAASYAEECLVLLRAYIKGQLPTGLASHTINGNQITKIDIAVAIRLEREFAAKVGAENRERLQAAGVETEDTIQIYFTR